MEWTGQANTQSILWATRIAATAGAQLCVFPELAVTGFHRQIRNEATSQLVDFHMQALRQACSRQAVALVLGAPTFANDGTVFNSCIFINE